MEIKLWLDKMKFDAFVLHWEVGRDFFVAVWLQESCKIGIRWDILNGALNPKHEITRNVYI